MTKKATAETFTEEEMDGLSDEERAALDYEEPGEGDETASAEEDEPDVPGDTEQAAEDPAKDAEADGAAAGEADKDEAEATPAVDAEAEPAPAADKVDQPDQATEQDDVAKLQEEHQATMAALDEEYEGLGKKVEDGDMTFAEYHVKVKEINDAKMAARSAFDDDLNWNRAQSTFFADEANAVFLDPTRQTFLQATIDQMHKAGELNGLDYGSAIAKAAERVKKAMNLGTETAAPAPKVEKKPAKPQPQIPQTLGDIPPADDNTIEPDRFRHLDKLTGDDLEAALAKMSTADVDAWLEQS